MAREIIDLTRSPSPKKCKPDLRQLAAVDRKPVVRSVPVTPLGPAKRVAGVSARKGKAGTCTGKTPVVKRESGMCVKLELDGDLDFALSDSLSLSTKSAKPAQTPSVLDNLLLSKQTSSFLSDSEDEAVPLPRSTPARSAPGPSRPTVKTEPACSHPNIATTPRHTARTPRRHVRDPDSESEADTGYISPSPAPSPPSPSRTAATPRFRARTRPRSSKKDVRKYLDLYAGATDASEDEDEEDEKSRRKRDKDWMDKYYDDSLGSLKDFIVPDDYSSSDTSDSEDTASDTDDDGRVVHSDGDGSDGSDEVIAVADEGELHFSPPPRLLKLPDLGALKLDDSDDERIPPILDILRTPGKPKAGTKSAPTPKGKTPSKKAWATERTIIAQAIFDELDKKVFGKKLGRGEGGAGAVLEWSNRLLTTAGTANSKWTRHGDGTRTETVKIVLSEKVLTGKDQILSTVAHEMCHLASWIISNERKNPHGRVFKSWAAKVMRSRPDIEVTTKHTYEIEYKYSWKCTGAGCSKIYKRHSKSIDINKQRCGRCKGRLEPMFEQRESNAFQVYLKAHMADAKASMPGESHAAVMRALSARWKEGEEGERAVGHAIYWKSLARAARG